MALEWIEAQPEPRMIMGAETMRAIREALAEPEQEPVARIRTWTTYSGRHADLLDWEDGITLLPQGEHLLYTSPPARKPLTDEEVEDEWERITGHSIFGGDRSEGRSMYLSPDEVIEFARAIERAHGITE